VRIETAAGTPGTAGPRPGTGTYAHADALPGPWNDAPFGVPHRDRRQLLTAVDVLPDASLARADLTLDPDGPATMIDLFVAALQLGQVLLYSLDGVARADSNTLWMRRTVIRPAPETPADGRFEVRLREPRQLRGAPGAWRSAEMVPEQAGEDAGTDGRGPASRQVRLRGAGRWGPGRHQQPVEATHRHPPRAGDPGGRPVRGAAAGAAAAARRPGRLAQRGDRHRPRRTPAELLRRAPPARLNAGRTPPPEPTAPVPRPRPGPGRTAPGPSRPRPFTGGERHAHDRHTHRTRRLPSPASCQQRRTRGPFRHHRRM